MGTGMHLLPRPKSIGDARSEFERAMGDPRTLCKYLAISCAGLVLIVAGLIALNFHTATRQRERIVIRIDDVGRAQAIGISSIYKIEPIEVKFHIGNFITHYYGRNRTTAQEDFAFSTLFLETQLATARMTDERTEKLIQKFIVSGDDQIDIKVNNIVVGDLSQPPYTVKVDFEKVYVNHSGTVTKREKYIDEITFTQMKEVPNAMELIDPLGFVITAIRENQAF